MAYSPPRASQFTDRLKLLRKSQTSDGYGGTSAVWSSVETDIAAAIKPMKGGEKIQAMRLTGTNPFEITLRANDITNSITTTDRLQDQNDRIYEVNWIGKLDDRERYLTIQAIEGGVK